MIIISHDGNELSDRLLGPAHRTAADGNFDSEGNPRDAERQGFHWGRALTESFTFLVIEQAYVVHTEYRSGRCLKTVYRSVTIAGLHAIALLICLLWLD